MLTDNPATHTAENAPSRQSGGLTIEWLGQTIASLCWMASVFVYGISSAGDGLQLAAASAWFIANMASAVSARKR